jgi:putative MATE family efflux protein
MNAVDRRIVALAIPALGSLAVEPVYVMVDTAIVGRLGTEQLAGLAIAATVLSFVFVGSNFLTYSTTERVARSLGAGDRVSAADVGVQAIWLGVLYGVPAAVLLYLVARPLCSLLGASGEVLDHASTYLSISAVGVPFFIVTLAVQGVLRGRSDYVTPLWILFGANFVNAVLEIVFVFGLDTGIAGSAWSTVIAQVGAAFLFVWRVRTLLAASAARRPSRAGMRPLASAGGYLLLRVGSMLAVFTGATMVAARIDAATLAAHQITMSMFLFLALSLDALAVPAQTIVAEQLGRGDRAAAAEVAARAVRLSLIAGGVLCVALATLAVWLPHLFTGDAAVAERATSAMWWLAVTLVPGGVAFAHDGILIGAGDYRFLGRAAFCYLLAVAPAAVLTLALPELGIAGIWGGLLFWMVIRAVVNDRRTSALLGVDAVRSAFARPPAPTAGAAGR